MERGGEKELYFSNIHKIQDNFNHFWESQSLEIVQLYENKSDGMTFSHDDFSPKNIIDF